MPSRVTRTSATESAVLLRPLVPLLSECAVFLITAAVLIYQIAPLFGVIYDDAYITLRYARNIARGFGAVYNPGEYVEGYTNFLWMMLQVPFGADGIEGVIFSQTLGVFFHFLTAVPLYFLLSNLCSVRASRITGICLYLLLPCAYFNATRGLETPLLVFLLLSVLCLFVDRRFPRSFGFFSALLVLTRPDALLWVLVLFAFVYFSRKNRGGSLRNMSLSAFSFLLILTPYLLWKFWYYGSLIPNTAYAKYGFFQDPKPYLTLGFQYFKESFCTNLFLSVLVPFIAAFTACCLTERRAELLCIPLLILIQTLYLITAGGDSIGGYRFSVPIFSLALICFVTVLDWTQMNTGAKGSRIIALAALGIAAVVGSLTAHGSLFSGWFFALFACAGAVLVASIRFPKRDFATLTVFLIGTVSGCFFYHATIQVMRGSQGNEQYIVGRFVHGGQILRKVLPENCSVSTAAAGAIAYYYDGVVIDELGLTDSHIAHVIADFKKSSLIGHLKGDGGYILERAPCVIAFESSWFSNIPIQKLSRSWLPTQNELLTTKRKQLFDAYIPVTFSTSIETANISFLRRKDVVLKDLKE